MGLRGPKPRISGVACVNQGCVNYNKPGTESIVSNGTYSTRSGRVRKYICRACGAVFCERDGTAFYDIRSPEDRVVLALKLILHGLSLRAVSSVLGVKLDTVRLWLARSAQHAQQVNELLVKGGGPRCLDNLMGGISSESVFGFFNFIEKHQAASAKG